MIYETPYILERAAELIDEGWCQGWWAANENDAAISWDSKHAVKFCLEAAIYRCEGSDRDVRAFETWIGIPAYKFNDDAQCKEDVIEKLLDCADYLRERQ